MTKAALQRGRQPRDRVVDRLPSFGAQHDVIRTGPSVRQASARRALVVLQRIARRWGVADSVARKVVGDRQQPRPQTQLGAPFGRVAVQGAVRAHEHLLGDVFGTRVVAQHPRDEGHDGLPKGDDDVLERAVDVARERLGQHRARVGRNDGANDRHLTTNRR